MSEEANMENMDLEKLAESMSGEDLAAARQKILDMIENEAFSEDIREGLKSVLSGNMPVFGGYRGASAVMLALGLAIVLFSIILFFGYKLYKSIKEKEKKKEEKKKLKQQKKKK